MALKAGGLYTVGDALREADFDLAKEAAVEYGDGVDNRRVKVGGLGFDSTDDTFRIPVAAESLEITLDGKVVATLDLDDADEDAAATATVNAPVSDDDSEV